MGIAYSVFALGFFTGFCVVAVREKLPWWWTVVVLVLPPAALFFLKRSGRGNLPVWSLAVVIGLAAAAGGEVYLYKDHKARNKYSRLPPVVREMIQRNDAVMASTIDLYKASAKLHSLGLVQSRVTDIKATLEQIGKMRGLISGNVRDIDHLVSYIRSHEDLIQREGLDWAFRIAEFYQDPHVAEHHISRERYFDAFETLLRFTYDHFDEIMEQKSARYRANYDAYYLRYRGVADRHNQINRERIRFQDRFVAAHPGVTPFLPGSHHLAPFKFWDQFSF